MPVVVDQVEIVPEVRGTDTERRPEPDAPRGAAQSTESVLQALERARERELRRSPR